MSQFEHKIKYTDGKYYAIYKPNHPRADANGYVYEHRLVAEQYLGRYLKDSEVVHHEDRNGLNNDITNLKIFATTKDHNRYHKGYEIYCKDKIWYAKAKYVCKVCGSEISSKSASGLCGKCYRQNTKKPSQEELQYLLSQYNYSEIGRQYGVVSNTVKKWAKSYDLYENCFHKVPSVQVLSKFMATHTLVDAAKHFAVPKDTIRRWCRLLNISIKCKK